MTAETPHNFCEYMEQNDKAASIPWYTSSLSQDANPLQLSDKKKRANHLEAKSNQKCIRNYIATTYRMEALIYAMP